MAQFDAYPNPNVAQSEAFPYFVVLQSDQLSQHSTRLCMPLARLPRAPVALPRRLTQSVLVEGERLYLAAHLCAALPTRLLKGKRISLRGEASAFTDALDAVLSGV
jgi:toxin CcdB